MTVTALNRDTFVAVTPGTSVVMQARGGRIELATSASPAADDLIVLRDGEYYITSILYYARAVDISPTFVAAITA